jgi:hypothetical protein
MNGGLARCVERRQKCQCGPARVPVPRGWAPMEVGKRARYKGVGAEVDNVPTACLRHNFSSIAVHWVDTLWNAPGQKMLRASDQRMSVGDFADSFNGIHIKVTASNVDFPDPWVANDGFRWLQTIVTNTPLAGRASQSVDPGSGPEPFYYDYSGKEPNEFEDYPNRGVPSAGQMVVWDATLTLVGVDRKEKYLTPYDIRTYGFRARLMPGTSGVSEVKPVAPKQDWSALGKHRAIVQGAYPDWTVSLLKGR